MKYLSLFMSMIGVLISSLVLYVLLLLGPFRSVGITGHRKGTAYGMEFIIRIMDVVGVDKWEN